MRLLILMLPLLWCLPVRAQFAALNPPVVHDPCIIASNGFFYVYSTGRGLPMFRSNDLYNWTRLGRAFPSNPGWALQDIPGVVNPWAPDISYFNGSYHLYYSMSTFGKNRSAIGLATNSVLDPADPHYHWVDQGKVFESFPTDAFNAIDPNLIIDQQHNAWLVLGSCWDGIHLLPLDPATGKPSPRDAELRSLARRPGGKLIEGPFIVHHGRWYFLFVSFDACCRGVYSTYKTMVGRSATISGPYKDMDGTPMMSGGGSLLIASQGNIRGPGHNAVLLDVLGRDWVIHHFYDAANHGVSRLQVRQLVWDENGWPMAGDPVVAAVSSIATVPKAVDWSGRWNVSLDFGPERNVVFLKDGSVADVPGARWNLAAGTVSVRLDDSFAAAKCIPSEDGLWFTGRDSANRIVRGRRPPH